MSSEQRTTDRVPWVAPRPFRAALEDLGTITDQLLAVIDGQVVVPAADVDFLARRLARLAGQVHQALPPEVS